jgi:hypothetical protein
MNTDVETTQTVLCVKQFKMGILHYGFIPALCRL